MLSPHLLQGAHLDGQVDAWAARGTRVLLFAYRLWAGRDELSGDRRPTWLAIVLLLGLLAIAVVPPLSGIFDLRPVMPLDTVVIAVAAAVWVFLVRWAWRRRLLERFVGTDLDR